MQQRIRNEIENQIKQHIPQAQLHLITIKENGIEKLGWKRKGKEFLYKGVMYDVVKSEKKDDSVLYYCITDVEETQLLLILGQLVKEHLAHSKKYNSAKKFLKYFLKKLYISQQVIESIAISDTSEFFFVFKESFQSLVLNILTPPPKQV